MSVGNATGKAPGAATVQARYDGCAAWSLNGYQCYCSSKSSAYGSAQVTVVSGSITVNLGPPPSTRSSSLSPGDALSFAPALYSCDDYKIGLQACGAGWFWQVEGAGTVSDDASKWTLSQKVNSGTLTVTDTTGKKTTTTVSNQPESLAFVQQTSGTKSIFWLDAPGANNSDTTASVTFSASLTSKICPKSSSTCMCVDWKINLLGNKNSAGDPVVDNVNSNASIAKSSYNCN